MTNDTTNPLYELLPIAYRLRDAEQGNALRALLSVIAEQVAVVEEDVQQLYDDQFIETCAPWVAPYIGDLIGYRLLERREPGARSIRAEVANTIAYRRRKGTAMMLEQLARDVTGWPTRAVEFFFRLVTTQCLNHLRREAFATVELRTWEPLARLGGAFESATHTADVRSILKGQGRYNIRNVGLFVWRLAAFSRTQAQPFRVDDHRYVLSPLGNDAPLFTFPEVEEEIDHLAEPANVPMPLSRRLLDAQKTSYYGEGKSVFVHARRQGAAETEIPLDEVDVCDLSDVTIGGQPAWANTPVSKVTLDPVLGRLAFPEQQPAPAEVLLTYHHGFSAKLGGGEYERESSFVSDTSAAVIEVPSPSYMNLQSALTDIAAAGGGVVEVVDNGRYEEHLSLHLGSDVTIELRAANGKRPTIVLEGGPFVLSGSEAGEVILNGFLIAQEAVKVDGLRRLDLRHCTLVPGLGLTREGLPESPDAPALEVASDESDIAVAWSIVGGLRAARGAVVTIEDSIVDATDPSRVAYAADDGVSAGGNLSLTRSTVIGKVHTRELMLASETIFRSRLTDPAHETWDAPVIAERRQAGCVRFSYVPPGSRVPRRFRCQPDLAVAAAIDAAERQTPKPDAAALDAVRTRVEQAVVPTFSSVRYGEPAYTQLDCCCPDEIRSGAEDGSEMGAFAHLQQARRERDLFRRLEEYLPFGLEAGIVYCT